METYDAIIKIIDANIIYCLIPLLLTIILAELFFKNRFKTKQVLNLVRWFLIFYCIVGIIHYLIGLIFFTDEFAFLIAPAGPYIWIMFLSATFFPLTLFYKKPALKPFDLIFIALFMKLGWYMERFIIMVPRLCRDLSQSGKISDSSNLWIGTLFFRCLQGFTLAIVLLAAFEFIERRKQRTIAIANSNGR